MKKNILLLSILTMLTLSGMGCSSSSSSSVNIQTETPYLYLISEVESEDSVDVVYRIHLDTDVTEKIATFNNKEIQYLEVNGNDLYYTSEHYFGEYFEKINLNTFVTTNLNLSDSGLNYFSLRGFESGNGYFYIHDYDQNIMAIVDTDMDVVNQVVTEDYLMFVDDLNDVLVWKNSDENYINRFYTTDLLFDNYNDITSNTTLDFCGQDVNNNRYYFQDDSKFLYTYSPDTGLITPQGDIGFHLVEVYTAYGYDGILFFAYGESYYDLYEATEEDLSDYSLVSTTIEGLGGGLGVAH